MTLFFYKKHQKKNIVEKVCAFFKKRRIFAYVSFNFKRRLLVIDST